MQTAAAILPGRRITHAASLPQRPPEGGCCKRRGRKRVDARTEGE